MARGQGNIFLFVFLAFPGIPPLGIPIRLCHKCLDLNPSSFRPPRPPVLQNGTLRSPAYHPVLSPFLPAQTLHAILQPQLFFQLFDSSSGLQWSFDVQGRARVSCIAGRFFKNAGDPSLIPGSGRTPGEGNGNPLQYACLENPTDRGAWWATVHGLAKGQTRLSNKHFHF